MNTTCNGHFIPRLRTYRCLHDGAMVKNITEMPKVCPNCKREVRGRRVKKFKLRSRFVYVNEICIGFPSAGAWVTLNGADNKTAEVEVT